MSPLTLLHYVAFVRRRGEVFLAELPDAPGCQALGPGDDVARLAEDALGRWLEAQLATRKVPPAPRPRLATPPGARKILVPVRAGLAAALSVRWARTEARLSQAELGRLAGITQQQLARLENPDGNPTVGSLETVARVLGLRLGVGMIKRSDDDRHPPASPPRSRG